MSETQKIIKYCAIGFAWFLVITIVSGIMFGIASLGFVFGDEKQVMGDNLSVLEISNTEFSSLEIDIFSASIVMKEADEFKVETNNKYITVKERNNKLSIEEKEHFISSTDSSLVISIPSGTSFNEVSIESGAGKVEIDNLVSRDVSLDLGAGKVKVKNLVVTGEVDIDGGAGAIDIVSGTINNLDLDMGVGKFSMKALVTGNNEIDAGVGDCDLVLIGSLDDYKIRVNKGVGEAVINNEKVENNSYHGNGSNVLLIDGGVGKIVVSFS